MKKLLHIAASIALLGGVLLVAPQAAKAATYDIYVAQNARTVEGGGYSCKVPDYDNLYDALENLDRENGTIYVCAGVYADDAYDVEDDYVTIIGAGAARTILDGECDYFGNDDNEDSIIYGNDHPLTIKNITLRNSCTDDGGDGGAIQNWGDDVYCYNSVFEHNYADDQGGAIAADYVYSNKCTFTQNWADADDSGYTGGAIAAYWVDLVNSTFTSNTSMCSGGAVSAYDGYSVTGSKFVGNHAPYCGGGALYSDDDYNVTVTNSTFTSNSANAGGAIFFDDANGWLTVKGGSFTSNRSVNDCGDGGAIYTDANLSVTQAVFDGNSLDCGDGEAIWVDDDLYLSRVTFKNNYGGYNTVYSESCNRTMIKVKWGVNQDVDCF